jgi:hypothetical protein
MKAADKELQLAHVTSTRSVSSLSAAFIGERARARNIELPCEAEDIRDHLHALKDVSYANQNKQAKRQLAGFRFLQSISPN